MTEKISRRGLFKLGVKVAKVAIAVKMSALGLAGCAPKSPTPEPSSSCPLRETPKEVVDFERFSKIRSFVSSTVKDCFPDTMKGVNFDYYKQSAGYQSRLFVNNPGEKQRSFRSWTYITVGQQGPPATLTIESIAPPTEEGANQLLGKITEKLGAMDYHEIDEQSLEKFVLFQKGTDKPSDLQDNPGSIVVIKENDLITIVYLFPFSSEFNAGKLFKDLEEKFPFSN